MVFGFVNLAASLLNSLSMLSDYKVVMFVHSFQKMHEENHSNGLVTMQHLSILHVESGERRSGEVRRFSNILSLMYS